MKHQHALQAFRILTIFAILFGVTSCWIWENNVNDFSIYDTFQIENVSSQEITLRFYDGESPKTVFVEILDQSGPVYKNRENAAKVVNELIRDSVLSLKSGQTMIFYEPILRWYAWYDEDPPTPTCLHVCGSGTSFYNTPYSGRSMIGDKIRISAKDKEDTFVSILDRDIWETWYDEKTHIYFHLWRIE